MNVSILQYTELVYNLNTGHYEAEAIWDPLEIYIWAKDDHSGIN